MKYGTKPDPAPEIVESLRKMYEEQNISIIDIGDKLQLLIPEIRRLISKYSMKRSWAQELPLLRKDSDRLLKKDLKCMSVSDAAEKWGLNYSHLSALIRISRSLTAIVKDRNARLDIKNRRRIEKKFKMGWSKDRIERELQIGRMELNRLAGDLDWKLNYSEIQAANHRKNIDRDGIVKEYLTGLVTVTELAARHNITVSTVSYILKERGVSITRSLTNRKDGLDIYAKVAHLNKLGWTKREIADFIGVKHTDSVNRRLNRIENFKAQSCKTRKPMPLETYLEILDLIAEGRNGADIAREKGFTRSHICAIKKRRWVHPGHELVN